MAIAWRWHGEFSIERDLAVEMLLSSDDSEYAGGIVYDETQPREIETFSARGLTRGEVQALRATAKIRRHLYTVVDRFGDSWTGYIERLGGKPVNEGLTSWAVTLQLLIPPEDPD